MTNRATRIYDQILSSIGRKPKADTPSQSVRGIERALFLAARSAANRNDSHLFFQGQNYVFGDLLGDRRLNDGLRDKGSQLRIFTEVNKRDHLIILGKAAETTRDGAQVLIFDEGELVSKFLPVNAYSCRASRIVISNGQNRKILEAQKMFARNGPTMAADPFLADFIRHVLVAELGLTLSPGPKNNPAEKAYFEAVTMSVLEHESAHIAMVGSGSLNHTAFKNSVYCGHNTIYAINEILADLRAIRAIAGQQPKRAFQALLIMMMGKYPPSSMPKGRFALTIIFNCLTKLLFHSVRPDGVDQPALLAKISELEPKLVALADESAQSIKSMFEDELDHLLPLKKHLGTVLRQKGYPERSIENYSWNDLYEALQALNFNLDAIALPLLPSLEEINRLFDFPNDGLVDWQELLSAYPR